MAQFLKQSTAVDVRLGPFVDVGDGFTPETGVTIAASDDKAVLKAGGAATVTMAGAFAAVTGADGWYDYTASATDLDTVGDVTFVMRDNDVYLPVFARFQVVEEEVYDDMFAASAVGYLKPTTAGRDVDVTATGEVGLDLDNTVGTIAAAQIATDAITAAKIAAAAITSSEAPNLDVAVSTRLAPTVAARTLDVAAGGEAGLDLDNTTGTIAAAQIATDAITAAKIAAGAITSSEAPNLDAAISSLNDVSQAEVLTQVNAALDTVISELGVAAPAVTPTLRTGLMLLYMALRNKLDVQTSGTDALEIHNDAGTEITSKLLTDDGSDYSEAKMT